MKVIQVDDETHEKAKKKAKEKDMMLRAYIKMLVNRDKK